MRRTRSGPRSCPAMLHLYVPREGNIAATCSEHGRRAPPACAIAPASTAPIGNGCGSCMGVQMRRNRSCDGWHKNPTVANGGNSTELEDDSKAVNHEIQGGRQKLAPCQRSRKWMDATLQIAMDAIIDHGMKMKAATLAFDIPATSLRDHLYGKITSRQRGNLPTLKPNEEKKLVDYIFKMQDLGHPLTPAKLRLKVALATQI